MEKLNLKRHKTPISIIDWKNRIERLLVNYKGKVGENKVFSSEHFGHRISQSMEVFRKALYQRGLYTSTAIAFNGREIYFTVKGEHPFYYTLLAEKRHYLKPGDRVRYFKDKYYVNIEGFSPIKPKEL